MATADFKAFLEDSLRQLDPSIDLADGSPAQTQFVEPVLRRLGADPFDMDIDSFISDTFAQEFPDIYAGDPGAVRDLFINPLILLLEPYKREIETLRRNHSLSDPSTMSDGEVSAFTANFFIDEDLGAKATGVVRVFYNNAATTEVPGTVRFSTASGLSYFPVSPMLVTAEEMVFNRAGALFYADIPIIAEEEGEQYNVEPGAISSVDGLLNAVRVINLRRVTGGLPTSDRTSAVFLASQALTERSLVTPRGASARISKEFRPEVRAVQVVGAGDEEMQRDILSGTAPGHMWATGSVSIYRHLALFRAQTIEGSTSDLPRPGEQLCVYAKKSQFPAIPDSLRIARLTIESVLFGPISDSVYECAYLLRWSGDLPFSIGPGPATLSGGLSRKGTIQIGSVPHLGKVSLNVPNGEVHLYGHTDIYVRPSSQDTSTAILLNTESRSPLLEREDLSTHGTVAGDEHRVSATVDLQEAGVRAGYMLTILSGDDAGSYPILKVDHGNLYLNTGLQSSQSNLRYRIEKRIEIDAFSPKALKFPFAEQIADDLQLTIDSNLAVLSRNDLLTYDAQIGDVIEVKSGTNVGRYTITGFDSTLGGRGVLLDTPAIATESGLSYEVYAPMEGLVRPLVRIKDIQVLDSSRQPTGVSVPPATPIGVMPTGDFSPAQVLGASRRNSGFVLPDLAGLDAYLGGNTSAPGGGVYSSGFEDADGIYKSIRFVDATYAELLIRNDAKGKCCWFVSPWESEDEDINYPPISPSVGDCLTLKSGPNAGSYLIEAVCKLKTKIGTPSGTKTAWINFIKIKGQFPADPFRELIDFLTNGGQVTVPAWILPNPVPFPYFFSSWFYDLVPQLRNKLAIIGLSDDSILNVLDSLTMTEYEWGTPARGTLRTYMQKPTAVTMHTGASNSPTLFRYVSSSGIESLYQPDPKARFEVQVVPPRLDDAATVSDLPRYIDTSVAGVASFAESVFTQGVEVGDLLGVHEELLLHGSGTKFVCGGLRTTAGSPKVVLPNTSRTLVPASAVGHFVCIEQGPDAGFYRLVSILGRTLTLDRPLTRTTEPAILDWTISAWGYDAASQKNVVVASPGLSLTTLSGKYITLSGVDFQYQGTYKVLEVNVGGENVIAVEREGDFPALANTNTGYFVVVNPPAKDPPAVRSGTELIGLCPFRMYEADESVLKIVSVDPVLGAGGSIGLEAATLVDGHMQPYRIYRKDCRRITPSDLEKKADGPFFYFDTDVVSLSPQPSASRRRGDYLEIVEGTYDSIGYVYRADDPAYTYSTRESGTLDFPLAVLPLGAEDSPENFLYLRGLPLRIDYERSELVAAVQGFISSGADRCTSANMLCRHFLPRYISYYARYSGGSRPDVIAEDIRKYLDALEVTATLDTSELQDCIGRRGGNPRTPTRLMALTYDWNRRAWLELSEDQIAGDQKNVPYAGTLRITCTIPGPTLAEADGAGKIGVLLVRD
jgi:hypothetical protein